MTFMHCGQTVGRIKMKFGMQVGLGPGHTVLGLGPGHIVTQPPRHFRPISVAAKWLHGSRCHLVWTMELGLGPGDFVLDEDAAPPP